VAAGAADPVQFTASFDRGSINVDETVSLKMSVTADNTAGVTAPHFIAPDFEWSMSIREV